jgi:hypothetical protein
MSYTIKQGFRRLLVKPQLKRRYSLEISGPTDFKHVYHVGFEDLDRLRLNDHLNG